MSQPWVILTRRYGEDIRSPSAVQLAEAVAELYHEALPGMTEGDYAEHGEGWLRCGYDEGPMFVLTVNRHHEVRLEEWADQDFEQELTPPRRMQFVAEEHALQLWSWMAHGVIDRVRAQPWE
jgi:hypothetical protein